MRPYCVNIVSLIVVLACRADAAAVAITTTDLVSKSVAIQSKVCWNSSCICVYVVFRVSLFRNWTGLKLVNCSGWRNKYNNWWNG